MATNARAFPSKGNHLYPVMLQQGSGHADNGGKPAGRAAGFQEAEVDALCLGNGQDHEGAANKGLGAISAMQVYDLGGSGKHVVTVAIDQLTGRARGGQSAQLLGADRYPVISGQQLHAISIGFAPAVVPGAQPGKTGADQALVEMLHRFTIFTG